MLLSVVRWWKVSNWDSFFYITIIDEKVFVGYLTQKQFQNVIDLFRQLEKPNEVNTLLFFNACAQLQTKDVLDLVKQVLSKMPLSYYKHFNLVTSLIDALMKCDDVETAERIFNQLTVKNNAICGAMMKGNLM